MLEEIFSRKDFADSVFGRKQKIDRNKYIVQIVKAVSITLTEIIAEELEIPYTALLSIYHEDTDLINIYYTNDIYYKIIYHTILLFDNYIYHNDINYLYNSPKLNTVMLACILSASSCVCLDEISKIKLNYELLENKTPLKVLDDKKFLFSLVVEFNKNYLEIPPHNNYFLKIKNIICDMKSFKDELKEIKTSPSILKKKFYYM